MGRAQQQEKAPVAEPQITIVRADGELGLSEFAAISDELFRLTHEGKTRIVLDLSGATHVDYRGIRMLGVRAELLRRAGGGLKLCGLTDYLERIVRASGAHWQVERLVNVEEAREAFARQFAYVA